MAVVAGSKPGRVYAFVEAKHGGLFRSDDWRREVDARQRRAQDPRARLVLLVDLPGPEERRRPVPPERRVAQVDRRRKDLLGDARARTATTTTCGSTRTTRTASSSATTAARRSRTTAARVWSTLYNQPTAQFYRVTTDNQFPVLGLRLAAGQLERRHPERRPGGEIDRSDWHRRRRRRERLDGASTRRDPNIVYAGEYGGIITRYDHRTRQSRGSMAVAAARRRARDART